MKTAHGRIRATCLMAIMLLVGTTRTASATAATPATANAEVPPETPPIVSTSAPARQPRGPAGADDSAPADQYKSRYHVFNPTPRKLMREMSTDRPDTTESPISVDAGHLQLESEAVNLERDDGAMHQTLGSLNLKVGLLSWSDLQVVFDMYNNQEAGHTGPQELTLRCKLNLWGNDGGTSAMALMPFAVLPTSSGSSSYVQGGLIAPLALEGPGKWEFGTMLELDAIRRERAYGLDLVGTVTAGHDILGPLSGFVEMAGIASADVAADVAASANSGLVLALSDDLRLDGGVRVGVTDPAPDLGLFLGGSGRY